MSTYLLDTSVIIEAINGKRGRRERLRGLVLGGGTLACCPINIAEIYAGIRPNEEPATAEFLRSLELCPLTYAVAELAGVLKRDYAKAGRTLRLGDVLIAATALRNGLSLLTDNGQDFPMLPKS
jgi:predicted nucleic acid-binding protein